jgi:hypothetical protein
MNYPYKYLFEWQLCTGRNIKIFAKTHSESLKRIDEFCSNIKNTDMRINIIPGNTAYYNGYYSEGIKYLNSKGYNNRYLVG